MKAVPKTSHKDAFAIGEAETTPLADERVVKDLPSPTTKTSDAKAPDAFLDEFAEVKKYLVLTAKMMKIINKLSIN
jgi:hypothetical protein